MHRRVESQREQRATANGTTRRPNGRHIRLHIVHEAALNGMVVLAVERPSRLTASAPIPASAVALEGA